MALENQGFTLGMLKDFLPKGGQQKILNDKRVQTAYEGIAQHDVSRRLKGSYEKSTILFDVALEIAENHLSDAKTTVPILAALVHKERERLEKLAEINRTYG